ncbi:MAG TPA: regulatory protein RecX [Lacisediminihabitans sp.]|uniref:regulatory protein RecX n=1 Tax=Lacisediminihabitans sp. TaxID=2787631 RepID=UPI002ED99B19
MGSGDGLAKVTYLPGVVPPSPEPVRRVAAPDFATFFGESDAADGVVDGTGASGRPERGETEGDRSAARGRREISAENVSMHALTRRGMSRWELEKVLLDREFDAGVVEAELDRLEGVGLIDDAALAETLVRTQHERKGLGRSALSAELRRRHIDQVHIERALEQVDDDDEQTRANELAIKRAGQLSSYDLETAKRRLSGFLMRKGYSSSVVRIALAEALSARTTGVQFR